MPSEVILIALFAFSLCKTISAEYLYNEIASLNAACFPSDSCSLSWYSDYDDLWGDRICECGLHCVRFQTCCVDSFHAGEKYYLPSPGHEQCQKLTNFPAPVIMVSSCADGWQWPSDVKDKCEKGLHTAHDHLLMTIPLTNTETLVTYRNYYCALCNYGGKNFLYWNVVLKTKKTEDFEQKLRKDQRSYVLDHVAFDANRKAWGLANGRNSTFNEVNVHYVLPLYLQKIVKRCYENLVATCNPSHRKSELERKCNFYYAPIEVETENGVAVFRNAHCALCNDVKVSSIKRNSCLMKISKRIESIPPSFAFLIDANIREGNVVVMKEVPEPDCGKDSRYDAGFKKCIELGCSLPGFALVNGTCVLQ